jgi:hypothetical protein
MSQRSTGYGGKWKKWLAIYVAAAAIVYLLVYVMFFMSSSGGHSIY